MNREELHAWAKRPVCEGCQSEHNISLFTIDGRHDGHGNSIGVPLCDACYDEHQTEGRKKWDSIG